MVVGPLTAAPIIGAIEEERHRGHQFGDQGDAAQCDGKPRGAGGIDRAKAAALPEELGEIGIGGGNGRLCATFAAKDAGEDRH